MKNILVYGKVMLFTLLFTLGSCSSNDDNDNTGGLDGSGGSGVNVNEQINELNVIMTSGSWIVTFYFDTDQEETNNYRTFAFVFNPQGSINASNGVETNNGTWSVTPDSSNNDIDFNINFSSPPDFAELSDDWEVILYTNNKLELRDVSSDNVGTDLLTFERL